MIIRIFTIVFICSFLTGISTAIQATEWDKEKSVLAEKERRLNPHTSHIGNIIFWDEDPESSWYIAINYLSCLQQNGESFDKSEDAAFFACAGAAYLRINYRLQDSNDPYRQASTIRDFEPCVADFVNNGFISLDSLWLEGLPEIFPNIVDQGMMQIVHTTEVPPKFLTSLPSTYGGTILWVGGERDKEHPFADKYILNVDKVANPDILADGSNAYHLMVLPDNKFSSIVFDHIGHTVLSQTSMGDVLKECCRILIPGGILTFKTEHSSEEYYGGLINQNLLVNIKKRLSKKGFQIIECELKQDTNEEWESFPFYIAVTAHKK